MLALTILGVAAPARAQSGTPAPSQAATPVGPSTRLRVAITCDACDSAGLKTGVAFVDFVDPGTAADVTAMVTLSGDAWHVDVTGAGRFAGRSRRLSRQTNGTTPADRQADLVKLLKLALVEYAADTPVFPQLQVTHARAGTPAGSSPHDPWNFWIFRVGGNLFANGQKSTSEGFYEINASANRVTEGWKMRFSTFRGINKSSFAIDETETVKSRLVDWRAEGLVVKSLGPRWSFGLTGSTSGSTYGNTDVAAQLMPGIEYDFFPYSESSKRSLTLQYNIGAAHYRYLATTIFDKDEETTIDQSALATLGLQQKWGTVGGGVQFGQQLSSLDRTRLTLSAQFNVRLLKSLTLNGDASYARIRDQFTLEKGVASDDEVLLRQRQLATGHRYSLSLGLSYSFGALGNAIVNPRFNN